MFARLNSTSRPTPTIARAREPARLRVNPQKTRYLAITMILAVALIAFEIFNFDTTKYALTDLLGDISFAGVKWAAILAVAFCGIDFAGLLRVFTPDEGDTPKEVGYLMAAWLLGATMNAVMTWYAVSITLLGHKIGNEVISREQLLRVVPIFVATLVWLTRILFIGALSIAGDHLWQKATTKQARAVRPVVPTARNGHSDQLIMRPRQQGTPSAFVPHAQAPADHTDIRTP